MIINTFEEGLLLLKIFEVKNVEITRIDCFNWDDGCGTLEFTFCCQNTKVGLVIYNSERDEKCHEYIKLVNKLDELIDGDYKALRLKNHIFNEIFL